MVLRLDEFAAGAMLGLEKGLSEWPWLEFSVKVGKTFFSVWTHIKRLPPGLQAKIFCYFSDSKRSPNWGCESLDVWWRWGLLLCSSSWRILDLRPEEDFLRGHVRGAYNVPWAEIAQRGFEPLGRAEGKGKMNGIAIIVPGKRRKQFKEERKLVEEAVGAHVRARRFSKSMEVRNPWEFSSSKEGPCMQKNNNSLWGRNFQVGEEQSTLSPRLPTRSTPFTVTRPLPFRVLPQEKSRTTAGTTTVLHFSYLSWPAAPSLSPHLKGSETGSDVWRVRRLELAWVVWGLLWSGNGGGDPAVVRQSSQALDGHSAANPWRTARDGAKPHGSLPLLGVAFAGGHQNSGLGPWIFFLIGGLK